MEQNKMGLFIQMLRKKRGLTQKELSQMLGVSDKTVSKWETGHGLPDTMLLSRLSEVLEVSVSELLSGESLPPEIYPERTEKTIMALLEEKEKLKKGQWVQLVVSIAFLAFAVYAVIISNAGSPDIDWYWSAPTLLEEVLLSIPCALIASIRDKGRFLVALQQIVLPVGAILGLYGLMNALIFYDSALSLIICLVSGIQPFFYAFIFYLGLTVIKIYRN